MRKLLLVLIALSITQIRTGPPENFTQTITTLKTRGAQIKNFPRDLANIQKKFNELKKTPTNKKIQAELKKMVAVLQKTSLVTKNKAQATEFKKQLISLKTLLDQSIKSLQKKGIDFKKVQEEFKKTKAALLKVQQELVTKSSTIKSSASELEKQKKELSVAAVELKQAKGQLAQISEQKAMLEEDLKSKLEEQQKSSESERAKLQTEIAQTKQEVATLTAEKPALEKLIAATQAMTEKSQQILTELSQTVATFKAKQETTPAIISPAAPVPAQPRVETPPPPPAPISQPRAEMTPPPPAPISQPRAEMTPPPPAPITLPIPGVKVVPQPMLVQPASAGALPSSGAGAPPPALISQPGAGTPPPPPAPITLPSSITKRMTITSVSVVPQPTLVQPAGTGALPSSGAGAPPPPPPPPPPGPLSAARTPLAPPPPPPPSGTPPTSVAAEKGAPPGVEAIAHGLARLRKGVVTKEPKPIKELGTVVETISQSSTAPQSSSTPIVLAPTDQPEPGSSVESSAPAGPSVPTFDITAEIKKLPSQIQSAVKNMRSEITNITPASIETKLLPSIRTIASHFASGTWNLTGEVLTKIKMILDHAVSINPNKDIHDALYKINIPGLGEKTITFGTLLNKPTDEMKKELAQAFEKAKSGAPSSKVELKKLLAASLKQELKEPKTKLKGTTSSDTFQDNVIAAVAEDSIRKQLGQYKTKEKINGFMGIISGLPEEDLDKLIANISDEAARNEFQKAWSTYVAKVGPFAINMARRRSAMREDDDDD